MTAQVKNSIFIKTLSNKYSVPNSEEYNCYYFNISNKELDNLIEKFIPIFNLVFPQNEITGLSINYSIRGITNKLINALGDHKSIIEDKSINISSMIDDYYKTETIYITKNIYDNSITKLYSYGIEIVFDPLANQFIISIFYRKYNISNETDNVYIFVNMMDNDKFNFISSFNKLKTLIDEKYKNEKDIQFQFNVE